MKGKIFTIVCINIALVIISCSHNNDQKTTRNYQDRTFIQDFSIKYAVTDDNIKLLSVACDRNGYIQVFSSEGLLRPSGGQFLFPGKLVKDIHYKPLSDKNIKCLGTYIDQLVYIDDTAILSNAWAGKLYARHGMEDADIFSGGKDFRFLVSNGIKLHLIKDSVISGKIDYPGEIRDIKYEELNDTFWILGKNEISVLYPDRFELEKVLSANDLTCFEILSGKIYAGTSNGFFVIDGKTKQISGEKTDKLPCPEITVIRYIYKNMWMGTTSGAFRLRDDGRFDYYASLRWLPSDKVIDIAEGPENSVLILTEKGLSRICFQEMTLFEKAMLFEKQVRERHIRHGFNATVSGIENGDISTGSLEDSDNDGLWTSMYLAGQAFRYSVTGEDDALSNIRESLDAMERLYTINPVPGFPSRSFERRGYKYGEKPWRRAEDPEWDWKSTTSSDEAIGHIFAFGVIAELVNDRDLKEKAIMLIDTLMSHLVKNNFYLIDWNGEPTLWGKWNPEYVNARPEMVGDRKLNSSNIIAMLQTAYHFTGKEKYRNTAFYLMKEHGYLENLMRPFSEIGPAPENADPLSRMLSEEWNHSDDEMYYCGYWGLYRYAFNDTLKAMYKKAILDHWEIEKPEKEGLWNIMTALTGAEEFDLDEVIWYLKQYPLDLINWSVTNSHRKDIEMIAPDFRRQTTREVLPPDELPVSRHNANRFDPDGTGAGRSEYSAGDIWLLPYWMGRFLGVISGPAD